MLRKKGSLNRWLYRGQRVNRIGKAINRFWSIVASTGLTRNYMETLEVIGRKSGRTVSMPMAITVVGGERYIVSMLGENAQWVQNVQAAGGRALLVSGRRERVLLEEVSVDRRAPILKAYLKRAPGARPHIPVDKNAPIEEFQKVAGKFPVFRVVPLHPYNRK